MLRVGLTGGVGSGKSAVASMLRLLGAQVSDSDEVGRRMMQPGHEVFGRIVAHFGGEVLTPEGTLSRGALARIAFAEGRVEELNSIVHPAVIDAQARWMDGVAASDPGAVAVVESALIFETKHAGMHDGLAPWRSRFDRIVVVTAPVTVRRQRYIQRIAGSLHGNVPASDFDRRAAAQWADEKKAALADFVVVNDGTLAELSGAVAGVYGALRQESADRAAEAM